MSKYFFFSFLCFTNLHLSAQTLIVNENFDGSQLNTTLWKTNPNWGHRYTDCDNDYYSFPYNVEVSNGTLKLKMFYQPGSYNVSTSPTPQIMHLDYTSGSVYSLTSYSFGIFEMRCKIPSNCRPSFWLYGECAEEIDVFEFFEDHGCDHSQQKMNIHKEKICGSPPPEGKSQPYSGPDFSSGFHIFTCIWSPNEIVWYTNGIAVRKCERYGIPWLTGCLPYNLFPTNPMHLIVSLADVDNEGIPNANCHVGDGQSPCTPASPTIFEIDYVRIWDSPSFACDYYNYDFGYFDRDINAGDFDENLNVQNIIANNPRVTVKNGTNAHWHAGNFILLRDGFETEAGANLDADLVPCVPARGNVVIHGRIAEEPVPYIRDSLLLFNSEELHLTVYPNPGSGQFHISCSDYILGAVSVVNVLGETVYETSNLPLYNSVIDLSAKPEGIYLLKITSPDFMYTNKLVISK